MKTIEVNVYLVCKVLVVNQDTMQAWGVISNPVSSRYSLVSWDREDRIYIQENGTIDDMLKKLGQAIVNKNVAIAPAQKWLDIELK